MLSRIKCHAAAGCRGRLRRWPAMFMLLLGIVLPWAGALNADAQVIDAGQMFSSSSVLRANQIISALQKRTGKTIFVESFAAVPPAISQKYPHLSLHQLFYRWAGEIGRSHHINGVVIVICRKPGYLIIRSGKATLGSVFSPADQSRASRLMLDLFRSGQYETGLLTGVQYIASTIEHHAGPVSGPHPKSKGSHRVLILIIVLLGIFVFFWLVTRRSRSIGGPPMTGMGGGFDTQASGLTPGTTPPAAGPAAGGGGSAMGSFVSGLAGGAMGAVAGNMLYNAIEGSSVPSAPPETSASPVEQAADAGTDTPAADSATDWSDGGTDDSSGGSFDPPDDSPSDDDTGDDGDADDGGSF